MRRFALTAASALLLVACGSSDDAPSSRGTISETAAESATDETPGDDASAERPADPDSGLVELEQVQSSPERVTLSGLEAAQRGDASGGLPEPLVDLAEIRSGGPPPDGIPPIDDPVFLHPADVDFIADAEPVLAFELDGDARAYPVQIMTWHEIVNDTVGGVPVAVTYCPLCNSAVAYDRRIEGEVFDFGTSGMLWNSALVMYDRQTETLWSHFTGEGIVGELTGVQLVDFPLATVSWRDWREAHPDGLVLSTETGFSREYGRNPYPGYDDVDGVPYLFEGEVDGTFTAMTRIVGVEIADASLGIPLPALQQNSVVATELAGTPLVAWWAPGTGSALDTASIAAGADVGATGVFVALAEGEQAEFIANGDGTFSDVGTGSTWNILGEAVAGPLTGERLEAVRHVDTFWFAWSTFVPDTEIVTGSA